MGITPHILPNKIYINRKGELTLENKQLPFLDNIPVDLENLNVYNFLKKMYFQSEQHFETLPKIYFVHLFIDSLF